VETEGRTVNSTDKTVVWGGFGVLNAVGVGFFAGWIVDVAAEVDVGWGRGVGGCYWAGSLTTCGKGTMCGTRLEGLETSWCVDDDSEVACKWRTHCARSCFRINLLSISLEYARYLIIN
jgi:hypothetical protein